MWSRLSIVQAKGQVKDGPRYLSMTDFLICLLQLGYFYAKLYLR